MYYICQTGTHTVDCHNMFQRWTALDGPNGMSLLSVAKFHSDDDQYNFESLAGVEPLPTSGTLTQEQADAISAIGLVVTADSTLADVRTLAKQHCPGM
jgi:hypothetical protein